MIFKTSDEMEKAPSFTGPHQFSMDSWIRCAPFERLLHMTILEAGGGKAVLTMPFLRDFAQGAGLMHGGALGQPRRYGRGHGHQEPPSPAAEDGIIEAFIPPDHLQIR